MQIRIQPFLSQINNMHAEQTNSTKKSKQKLQTEDFS